MVGFALAAASALVVMTAGAPPGAAPATAAAAPAISELPATTVAATNVGSGDGPTFVTSATGGATTTTSANAPPSPVTTATATTVAIAPTTGVPTVPPTTPPPVALLDFQPSPPIGLTSEYGTGPQYTATAVVRPSAQHDWLMVGTYRSNPGAVSQVVVYTAPAQSPGSWSQTANTGEQQPASARAVVTTPAGAALIVGSVDDADGPRPAFWVLTGTPDALALGSPTTPAPANIRGRFLAATIAADGTISALVERFVSSFGDAYLVGRRDVDGTWTFTPIRTPERSVGFEGIAAIGDTVVVVGSGIEQGSSSSRFVPLAYTSVDGGATFGRMNTAALTSATRSARMGDVVAGPAGFFASACLAGEGIGQGAERNAVATSVDGLVWTELRFSAAAGPFPLYSAGCADIAVDADGGVWLGGATSFVATFYRVLGGVVDRAFVYETDVDGVMDDDVRFDVSGGVLAVAAPVSGGMVSGFGTVADATDIARPRGITSVGGPPASHEIIVGVSVINDASRVVGLDLYPQLITERGSVTYSPRTFTYTLGADGTPVAAPDAAPTDPQTGGNMTGIASLPGLDVSLATVSDTTGEEYTGRVGDVVVSRRPAGGTWSPFEIVAGGLGAQVVRDVVAVGGLVVGVGSDTVTNQDTNVDEGTPLVLVGDGATFERIELDVGGSKFTRMLSACALPTQQVLALGYDRATDQAFSAIIDPVARTATVRPPSISPPSAVPLRCVEAPDGALVEVADDTGTVLYSTTDGVTFRPLDVFADDESSPTAQGGVAGVAVVGRTGPAGEDAFVLFGRTIDTLQRVEVPTFVGAGRQEATGVVIAEGVIYVLGTINGSAVVWPVTYSERIP